MTRNDSKFPVTLRRKGKEVTIYKSNDRRRQEEYFTVAYYIGEKRKRLNRKSLKDAESEANTILDQLCKNRVPVSLTPQDWELLQTLKKASRNHSSPFRFLDDAEAAAKILQGKGSLTEAAEYWSRRKELSEIRVEDAFEEYLGHLEKQKSSDRHIRDVRSRIGRFAVAFRKHFLSNISHQAVEEFLDSLDVGDRTRNNYRSQTISFFRWAQERGYLEKGEKTEPEKVARRKLEDEEVEIFSVEQTSDLFRGLREDIVPYTAIAAFAGLRPSEIQRLRWGAIKFEEGYIYVSAEVAQKTGRSRYIPFAANIRDWLLPYQGPDGELVSYFKAPELLSEDARKRGVVDTWPPDVLRHSFCSYRLEETKDIGLVAEEAGNSPAIIRENYRRPLPPGEGEKYFSILPDDCQG